MSKLSFSDALEQVERKTTHLAKCHVQDCLKYSSVQTVLISPDNDAALTIHSCAIHAINAFQNLTMRSPDLSDAEKKKLIAMLKKSIPEPKIDISFKKISRN